MTDGIINVYKEKGYTSHDVVARLRGIVKQKKIGHTGTLDPDAEGVLPVCLGKATKVCDLLTDHTKTYRAVLLLGRVTDTQDLSGQVLRQNPVLCSETEVRECISSFIGEQEQIPPMYSALKVNGQRLYDLARKGIEVERAPRRIVVDSIEICRMDIPEVELRISCSKGTYIRTLCNDMGEMLGCGGCMKTLLRERVGMFRLEQSVRLEEIRQRKEEGTLDEVLLPVDMVFEKYPAVFLSVEAERMVRNGNPLSPRMMAGCILADFEKRISEVDSEKWCPDQEGMVRLYSGKREFLAVYEWNSEKKCFHAGKMFL